MEKQKAQKRVEERDARAKEIEDALINSIPEKEEPKKEEVKKEEPVEEPKKEEDKKKTDKQVSLFDF